MAAYQVVLKRSPNMVIITSNDAAFYPSIQQFDRILCDVPCTGDGTMRKTYGNQFIFGI
jgi:16S rRNA C967 or C1407 C5-methylase (RsmB/RsmF family)